MGKFTLFLIIIYALYYLGCIVFDLFLKKDIIKEESDEIELVLPAGNEINPIQSVVMDDVQDIRTPSTFEAEDPLLEQEEEEEVEEYPFAEAETEPTNPVNDTPVQEMPVPEKHISTVADEEFKKLKEKQANKERFDSLLLEAWDNVQVLDKIDGHNTYQSTLNIS